MTLATKSRTSRRESRKSLERKARRIAPKPAKKPRTTIPSPQVARIIQRYISGEGIRKIAREEKRDPGTVAKIVRSEEVLGYTQKLREQYYALGELALDGLRRALEKNSDGRLAHELLRNIGVIPNSEEAHALERRMHQAEPATEEQAVKKEMLKLVLGAYERAKMFRQPFPALDEPDSPQIEPVTESRNGFHRHQTGQ
jgi:hypothetical protein